MSIKTKILLLVLVGVLSNVKAQTVVLSGNVIADDDVEGIHILNLSNNNNTVTNERGSFEITASLNDTIVISAIMYEPIRMLVTAKHINDKYIAVKLDKKINLLDEVLIGKILTGSLDSDIDNNDTSTINLQQLGIPGYYGRQLTQPERRLHDADHGTYISSFDGGPFGLGLGINVHKILNKVSGRTKKLKHLVVLDTEKSYIEKLKSQFGEQIFENQNLTEGQKNEFFFYCADDPEFINLMKTQGDLAVVNFLYLKLESFNNILKSNQD